MILNSHQIHVARISIIRLDKIKKSLQKFFFLLFNKKKSIAAVWDAHATIYHGYEICGLENLPKDSNGLLIYYHGAIPIDMYYFVARIYLKYDRLIYTVGDRFLFKLPGWEVN